MKHHFAHLLCLISLHLVVADLDQHVQELKAWFSKNKGRISKKIEIRRADPKDPNSRYGFFAKEIIHRKELLISVPRDVVFTDTGDEDERIDSPLPCETAFALIDEMKKGNESDFAPYINYLKHQPSGQLPSAWSDAGKQLLLKVIDDLPPGDSTTWLEHEWHKECEGGYDPLEENAAMMVISRGWDYVMIPVFDMMNHRNGKWLNSDSNSIYENENILIRSTQQIKKGAEIYTSYNFCRDCGGRKEDYGTPEILRDYGFVEDFPQRWIFDDSMKFDLDQNDKGELELTWLGTRSRRKGDRFIQGELNRLTEVAEGYLESPNPAVPQKELDTIKQYHSALVVALTQALGALGGHENIDDCISGSGSCDVSDDRYNTLDEDEDDLEDENNLCDNHEVMEFKEYNMAVDIKTQYQDLYFKHNPKSEDTCLDIGDTVQICSNYRPHYHELCTHLPARFIDEVKRVLWVGGGDSMLLHEILKYPKIELAVGLELDQTVTRGSFMHFGTQPHWDNDKVEWWFGDATKSLLMLPKEYFGSFDMILVDLSETVMSLSVTDHLDVFEALSLLLQPQGIMVKNELYFRTMSEVFNYTVEIHYHDVPVICSQALSISSNHLDFIQRDMTDHGVETLLLKPVEHSKDGFELIHSYARNLDGVQRPRKDFSEFKKELDEQETSPGILMILEAEDTTIKFDSSKEFAQAVINVLQDNGFETKLTIMNSFDSFVSFILGDGYITARNWPEHNYWAFDIHFWSRFDKQVTVKNLLLGVVGCPSGSASSYRIVAGGMYGMDSWKEDAINRGPRASLDVEEILVAPAKASIEDEDTDIMFAETISFIPETGASIVVICGHKSEDCRSLDVIKNAENVGEVVPLYSCDVMEGVNEYTKDSTSKKYDCEIELLKILRKKVAEKNKKLRGIVLDTNATFEMGQIIYSIFQKYHSKLLTEDILVMVLKSDSSEFWRRAFVDKFRESIIVEEPVYRAEVLFNSTDTNVELGIVSSGDFTFPAKLTAALNKIDDRTGLIHEIRKVIGGSFSYQPDFLLTQYYHHRDYPQAPGLKQWQSQQPLGHQTVMQLEVSEEDSAATFSHEEVRNALDKTFSLMISDNVQDGIKEFTEVGDGSLFVALWSKGSIMVLWDGRTHVDINMYVKHDTDKIAKFFVEEFKTKMKVLNVTMRDSFPRGYGKVVNFLADVEPRIIPHWATHLEKENLV